VTRVLSAWLPVVAWAALVFTLSSIPDLGTGLGGWDLALRKVAHAAEYAVLGALLLRAVGRELPAAAIGNWRPLLERFAEDHARVYLRPNPDANAELRRVAAAGTRVGAFTDAPEPLARVAAAHLGVGRRLDALEAGPGALDRLLTTLGPEARVVRSLDAF